MRKSKLLKGGLLAVFLLAAFLLPLTASTGESAAEGGGFYATTGGSRAQAVP